VQGVRIGLLLTCVAVGGAIGGLLSARKKRRCSVLREICEACDRLREGIAFHHKPVKELLEDLAHSLKTQYKGVLLAFSEELSRSERKRTRLACKQAGLVEDETECVISMLSLLGTTDTARQEEMLSTFKERVSEHLRRAETERDKTSSACLKLGLLGGLAVGILVA